MKLETLCGAANIPCPGSVAGEEVEAICTNSQTAVPNSLFVCIKGLHHDSHALISEAASRGARWGNMYITICEIGRQSMFDA